MWEAYAQPILEASRLLADAILTNESGLPARALGLDADVMTLVRQVGNLALQQVFTTLARDAEANAKASGMTPQRRPMVSVRTLLGIVEVESPYLTNPATKETARPVKDALGLVGGTKTPALERALTDFGIEESFEQASQRLVEHYGQEVGRTSILRVVKKRATEAEAFVRERLGKARDAFHEPLATRPGAEKMLVEIDGSMVRTGTLAPNPEGGTTETRGLPARKREERWREVRVGFARQPGEVDRTYVARMDSYPAVVGELFSAATDRGLSEKTTVYAVSDGGNGLREELDAQFAGLRFVLDRPHLKSHLWEAAAATGVDKAGQRKWVEAALTLIDSGSVGEVIAAVAHYGSDGTDRMRRLAGYLERFRDALDYEGAKEAGIPIGSGEVESAHRYIPQKRLKLPGACWHPDTINPMLALRVLRANGWWEEFWASRPRPAAA